MREDIRKFLDGQIATRVNYFAGAAQSLLKLCERKQCATSRQGG